MKNKVAAIVLLAMTVAVLAIACGGGATITTPGEKPTSSSGVVDVAIKNFAFDPSTVTVKAGTTIKWTNKDSAPHTIASNSGDWTSGNLPDGKSFSQTFTKTGSFDYHCSIHPSMKGTVIVTE